MAKTEKHLSFGAKWAIATAVVALACVLFLAWFSFLYEAPLCREVRLAAQEVLTSRESVEDFSLLPCGSELEGIEHAGTTALVSLAQDSTMEDATLLASELHKVSHSHPRGSDKAGESRIHLRVNWLANNKPFELRTMILATDADSSCLTQLRSFDVFAASPDVKGVRVDCRNFHGRAPQPPILTAERLVTIEREPFTTLPATPIVQRSEVPSDFSLVEASTFGPWHVKILSSEEEDLPALPLAEMFSTVTPPDWYNTNAAGDRTPAEVFITRDSEASSSANENKFQMIFENLNGSDLGTDNDVADDIENFLNDYPAFASVSVCSDVILPGDTDHMTICNYDTLPRK